MHLPRRSSFGLRKVSLRTPCRQGAGRTDSAPPFPVPGLARALSGASSCPLHPQLLLEGQSARVFVTASPSAPTLNFTLTHRNARERKWKGCVSPTGLGESSGEWLPTKRHVHQNTRWVCGGKRAAGTAKFKPRPWQRASSCFLLLSLGLHVESAPVFTPTSSQGERPSINTQLKPLDFLNRHTRCSTIFFFHL